MKQILTILFLFFSCVTYSQNEINKEISAIEAEIIDISALPSDNGRSKNSELNKILEKHNVIAYKLIFPNNQNKLLKNLVEIKCNCDPELLCNDLQANAKDLFKNTRHFENDKPDYEPSDDMWDAGDWLWHLRKIEADKAWDITKGSNEIIIAIIDDNFDITHPDLSNKFNPTYDPLTNTTFQAESDSHGTGVAGSAAAETDGGDGLAAVGFKTRLVGYRKQGSPLEEAEHASFTLGAHIISYSYSGGGYSQSDSVRVRAILDNGTIIVRSAGNTQNSSDANRTPFAEMYDERVIIVSSTDSEDNHTSPSTDWNTHGNYPEVDLCAPGYGLMIAQPTLDSEGNPVSWPFFGFAAGTSHAAPMVAGVCALMKSKNPCLSPSQTQSILKNTTDPINDASSYPNGVGTGRVNAYQAVLGAIDMGTIEIESESYTGTETIDAPTVLNVSNSTIQNNADITFRAPHEVNLESDFEVRLGGEFEVKMEHTCSF